MPIVDLSHVINPNTTMFPGTEKPVFQRLEIEGYPEVKITMYTHTGTHIDAPIHILKDAKCLDDFSIDKFVGKGVVINCKGLTGKSITVDHLKKYEHKIKDAEFILLNSGWSSRWYSDEYFEDFPTLTAEAAEWLTQFNLKGIGLDSISLDEVADMTLPNHHIVLKKEIIIIENMTNMDSLPESEFTFHCLPLKIEKADGSPTRAVAIFN